MGLTESRELFYQCPNHFFILQISQKKLQELSLGEKKTAHQQKLIPSSNLIILILNEEFPYIVKLTGCKLLFGESI